MLPFKEVTPKLTPAYKMSTDELIARLEICDEINHVTQEELNSENVIIDDLIKNNMFITNPKTIYFYELPTPSKHTVLTITNHLNELSKDLDSFNFILDLSRVKQLSVEIREEFKGTFLKDLNIKTLYIFAGNNVIIKLTAKFILSTLLNKYDYVFVKTREEINKLSQDN